MRVVWSPKAMRSAHEIHDCIRRRNPAAAERILEQIFAAGNSLDLWPERHWDRGGGKRQIRVGKSPYVIRYQGLGAREGRHVVIVDVRHGARAGE